MVRSGEAARAVARSLRGLAAPIAVLLALQLPASAATIVVDSPTGVEPGTCSLAEAIDNADDGGATHPDCAAGDAGADTIELTLDIQLLESLPEVNSEIVIEGNGFTVERFAGLVASFNIFFVWVDGDLSLYDITVRGGEVGTGGGIYNVGTVSLIRSTVSNNSAVTGGGIYSAGTLSLSQSTVSNNSADVGGGIYSLGTLLLSESTISDNEAAVDGGGVHNSGTATLVESTVSENLSIDGGGIYASEGTLTLEDSTVSFNVADAGGGGTAFGGGIFIGGSCTAYLNRSTIAGNSSIWAADPAYGGGLYVAGSAYLDNVTVSGNMNSGMRVFGYAHLENSTVYGNTKQIASADNLEVIGTVDLEGALIGGATSNNCALFVGGDLDDLFGSLADDSTCGTVPATLHGVDPVLADNGGPTKTHALLPGSNAIDHAGSCGLTVDQRGNSRDAGACDAGAFELSCFAPDGAFVLLEMGTAAFELYEACWRITAQNDYSVVPGGFLTLRSGREVVLGNDFGVFGGSLTIEIDPDLQMPPRPKVVFITSDSYPGGTLGGLAAADAHCNERASAAGRSGSFRAWLSDSQCAVADACRGFTQASVPYIRPDSVRVADDWADLTDGQLQAAISIDEVGADRSGRPVWTGTAPDGSMSANGNCTDWAVVTSDGGRGWSAASDGHWSDNESRGCGLSARLYCFEQ